MHWRRVAIVLVCLQGATVIAGCSDQDSGADRASMREHASDARNQVDRLQGMGAAIAAAGAGAAAESGGIGATVHASPTSATSPPVPATAPAGTAPASDPDTPPASHGSRPPAAQSTPPPADQSTPPPADQGTPSPAPRDPQPSTIPTVRPPSVAFTVSDVDESMAFYTGPLKMQRVGEIVRTDRREIVMMANSGPVLFGLMEFTDGISRDVANVPAKLIFGVSDAAEAAQQIRDAGYTFQIPGIIASDPDGYGAELLPEIEAGTDHAIVAVGLFVSDYLGSIDFYVEGLGMVAAADTGLGPFMEKVMIGAGLPHGILIMHYEDGVRRNYKDNPVKLSFTVPNAAEALIRVEAAGGTIVAQPTPVPALADALVGVAKDLDGYTLEFVQR